MATMPKVYGLSEDQIKSLSESWTPIMKRVRGMAMVMGVGPGVGGLFSKTVALMRVDDAPAFMVVYEKSLREYSDLVKKVNSPLLSPPAVERTTIGGTAALEITMKVPEPPAGQPRVAYAKMMESFFIPGGKIVAWIAPADAHTVVFGYTDKRHVQQTIDAIKQGKPGLGTDAELTKTAALLPPGAPCIGYWSPKGTIDFVAQTIRTFAPPGAMSAFSDFPATPPIGLAITTAPDELQTHVVVPADVFKAVGEFVGKLSITSRVSRIPEHPLEQAAASASPRRPR
jgi:hypothetical protein